MSIFTKAHNFVDWIEVKWWAVDRFWKYKILRRRHKEWPFILSPESLAILHANTPMTKFFCREANIPAKTGKEIQFFQCQPLDVNSLTHGTISPNEPNGAWQQMVQAQAIANLTFDSLGSGGYMANTSEDIQGTQQGDIDSNVGNMISCEIELESDLNPKKDS